MSFEQRTDLHGRIKNLYVEEEYKWCPDSNARNQDGKACHWKDPQANEYSLLGAVYKVYKDSAHWFIVQEHLSKIFGSGFWEWPLIQWNEVKGRTYQEVLEFLDKYKL